MSGIKRMIDDDAEVQRIARTVGVGPFIAECLAQGLSGTVAAEGWVFTFTGDGLLAVKAKSPVEQAALLIALSATIGHDALPVAGRCAWPTWH